MEVCAHKIHATWCKHHKVSLPEISTTCAEAIFIVKLLAGHRLSKCQSFSSHLDRWSFSIRKIFDMKEYIPWRCHRLAKAQKKVFEKQFKARLHLNTSSLKYITALVEIIDIIFAFVSITDSTQWSGWATRFWRYRISTPTIQWKWSQQ